MKQWYSASELINIPGIPSSKAGIILKAKRDLWESRKRSGRGGGREYHIRSLPPETRTHLQRETAIECAQSVADNPTLQSIVNAAQAVDEARLKVKQDGLAQYAALPDGPKKQRIKARKLIVELLYEWRRHHTGTKSATRSAFCDALNASDLSVPAWCIEYLPNRHGRHALTEPTLERWEQAYQKIGLMGLSDGYGNRKHQSKIETNDSLRRVILGCMLKHPHITSKKLKQYLEAAEPDLNIVSEGAIRRFMIGWKRDNAQIWTYMTNPDKWKNVFMSAAGSHFERITRLNQVWELDSTPGDWILKDGRHVVIGCIDMYSRRLKLLVSKTSKALAVCQLFRRSVIDWGIPEAARTDNGKDFVSEQFDSVLNQLEITHEVCIPFASEEKGTIERALQTVSHGILDLLPGFIGHNVAERKIIEARKSFAQRVMTPGEAVDVDLTSDELQEKLDQWTDHIYAHDAHGGLKGKTPFEAAAGWSQPIARIADERALDMLLAEIAGTGTITKKGLRRDHYWYIHPALFEHVGSEVHLRRDEHEQGKLYVYSLDGEFICIAECPELTGISRKEVAAASKHHQKKFLSGQSAEYRQFKRDMKRNVPEAVLQHRIAQSEKLSAFPAPSEPYTTPALEEAARAARAGDAPERLEQDDEDRRLQQEVIDDLHHDKVHELRTIETSRQFFQRWVRLGRKAKSAEALTDEEWQFLIRHANSAEIRSELAIHRDMGLTIDELPVETGLEEDLDKDSESQQREEEH